MCSRSFTAKHENEERNETETDTTTEDVSEWKAYLKKMKNPDEESGSEEDGSDGSSSLVDLSGVLENEESYAEDEVPGYFLHVTGEGVKIWILADRGADDRLEISDSDVQQLLARSDVNDGNGHDKNISVADDTFAPFHLTKADAVANVTRVRALSACAASYEAALKAQQESEARRREAMRAQTMSELGVGVGGAEVSLSVAERKKLLWDSSGKLASGLKK